MKILMICSEYPPAQGYGLGRYAHGLAKGLRDSGHSIHILTCNVGQDPNDDHGIHVHGLPAIPSPKHFHWTGDVSVRNLHLIQEGVKKIQNHGPFDWILSHNWITSGALKTLRTTSNTPWALFLHNLDDPSSESNVSDFIFSMGSWAGGEADAVFTTSHFMAKRIREAAPTSHPTPVGGGVDTERFYADGNLSSFREVFAPKGTPLIAFVGRLSEKKGVLDFLSGVKKAQEEGSQARVAIIGDGAQGNELIDFCKGHSLEEHVQFYGKLGDKALGGLYRVADALFIPSKEEPFGLVAIEAIHHGCRVFASKVGGLKEIAHDFPSDMSLLESTSADAIAKAIHSVETRCTYEIEEKMPWSVPARKVADALTNWRSHQNNQLQNAGASI